MRHGQPQLPVGEPARRPADVCDGAILAHIAVLELQLQVAFHDVLRLALGDGPVVRMHQVEHAAPHHFGRCVAKDALECGADKHDAAVGLHHAHGVQQQVDNIQRRNTVHGVKWAVGACSRHGCKPLCRDGSIHAFQGQKPWPCALQNQGHAARSNEACTHVYYLIDSM